MMNPTFTTRTRTRPVAACAHGIDPIVAAAIAMLTSTERIHLVIGPPSELCRARDKGECEPPCLIGKGIDSASTRARGGQDCFWHIPEGSQRARRGEIDWPERCQRTAAFHGFHPESGHSAFGQLRPLRLTGSMSESGQSCLSRIRGEHPLTGVIRTEDYMLIACSHGKISGSHFYLYAPWFRFPSRL